MSPRLARVASRILAGAPIADAHRDNENKILVSPNTAIPPLRDLRSPG
jgi:hypothetical protein